MTKTVAVERHTDRPRTAERQTGGAGTVSGEDGVSDI